MGVFLLMSYTGVLCTELAKDYPSAIGKLSLGQVVRQKKLEDDQVRIQIHASSLNFPDILQLIGQYQFKPDLPFVPGTEASGVIIEKASNVTKYNIGDEVMISMVVGSHAEEIIAYESQCVRKPRNFTHIEASGLSVGFATAYHGLIQRGNLTKGETLLVTGAAGGMGIAAIQLGKLVGARVIAAASSDDKVALAKQAGADEGINYSTHDLNNEVKKLTGYEGANVIYEVVGGDVFDKCARCVSADGRLLVVGFASGRIPKLPANLPLIKRYSVVGVAAGAAMKFNPETSLEISNAMEKWGSEGILPAPLVQCVIDVHKQGIEGVRNAFTTLATRKAMGKIVLVWHPSATI